VRERVKNNIGSVENAGCQLGGKTVQISAFLAKENG